MHGLVSIITPCYNASAFIREAIESVLSQTYREWELLIVDDCSTDSSVDIVREYLVKDPGIKLISLPKKSGAAAARNAGIEAANGKFIAFLDSDDIWLPEKLTKQLAFMENTGAALSFTAYYKTNEQGDADKGIVPVPATVTYGELLKGSVIGCSTAMYDASLLDKVYMPDILKRQDYGLWLAILKKTEYGHGLREPLTVYRVRTRSLSSNKVVAALYQWKIYREVEKLPLWTSLRLMLSYAYRGYLKYTN